MAIVKGLNTTGRFSSDAIGLVPVLDPSYGYAYSYGYPSSSQLRQSFPVVLGGRVLTETAISPLIPGDIFNKQNIIVIPKSYDLKYPNKARFLPYFLPQRTEWSNAVNDSVTTSDNVIPQLTLGDPIFPMLPGVESSFFGTTEPLNKPYPVKAQIFVVSKSDFVIQIDDSVTPSDAEAFDVGMQIDDTLGLADNVTPDLALGQIPFLQSRPYDKPQTKGPYGTFFNVLTYSTNYLVTIPDSVSLSDAQDFVPPLIVAFIPRPMVPTPR